MKYGVTSSVKKRCHGTMQKLVHLKSLEIILFITFFCPHFEFYFYCLTMERRSISSMV